MQPMGSRDEELIAQEAARLVDRQQQEVLRKEDADLESTEIAYPEDRYGIACIGCGIEMHLQMIPHRDKENLLVGWVFACEKCRPNIIGRRVWFGDEES